MITVAKILQFNPTGTPGKYTITAPSGIGLKRDDGSTSQLGDVLSVQPDGSLQTRPKGTEGAFELCTREGLLGVYQIDSSNPVYIIAPSGF